MRPGWILVLAASACGGADGGSALRFETSRLDLGTMFQYDEKVFSLPFTIEGDAPVRIEVLDTSCGCTDVRLVVNGEVLLQAEKRSHAAPPSQDPGTEEEDEGLTASAGEREIVLKPGTRGEVLGTYRPERRLNHQVVGVTIIGDMLNSPARAEIHAFLKPVFVLEKDAASFGTVLQEAVDGGRVVREFSVQAARAFSVKLWKNVPEGVAVELVEGSAVPVGDGPEVVQTVRVRLLPGLPIAQLRQFAISGDTSLGAPLGFVVAWRVVGPVTYAPDHLIQFLNKSNAREHEFVVKVRPSLDGITLPAPKAELLGGVAEVLRTEVSSLAASPDGRQGWLIRVTLPQGTTAATYQGTLRISYPDGSGITPWEMVVNARVQEPR
jgi:hypothetical protein